MLNQLSKSFFNFWYRLRAPKMVKYWLKNDKALARIRKSDSGSYEMQIQGEEMAMPGFPRGPVLLSTVAKLKHEIKTRVFNAVAEDLKNLTEKLKIDMIEPDTMVPAVRHIWDTFEKLELMEVTEDMRQRIKLMKEVICFFLGEDDAYRFRTQMFLGLLNQRKVRLSKQDLYYARAKYWKPDRFKRILGRWYDGYQY